MDITCRAKTTVKWKDSQTTYSCWSTRDKPDPNELPSADKEVSYIIKYGKCKKCGFGDVGVAKTVEIYDYDIMDIKRFMMDPLSSNDKYYNPRITND